MPPFLPKKRIRSPSPAPLPKRKDTKSEASTTPKVKGKLIAPPRKKGLFDALDAQNAPSTSNLLQSLRASSTESLSSLSSDSEPEFEDVTPAKPLSDDEDSDDVEFEDVEAKPTERKAGPAPSGDLELTLTKGTNTVSISNPHGTKKGPTTIERNIRVMTHRMHVFFLLWHNAIRNAWCCDRQVQKILVGQFAEWKGAENTIEKWRRKSGLLPREQKDSKGKGKNTPKGKTSGRQKETPAKKEDVRKHRDWGTPAEVVDKTAIDMSSGDPLYFLLETLSKYWRATFRITAPGIRKTGYMSLQRLEEEMKSFRSGEHDPELYGERIKNIKEFRECARKREGSRDVAEQLFTALLRGLGIEARMVASLQPVGFGFLSKANEDAGPRKKKSTTMTPKAPTEDNSDPSSSDSDQDELAKAPAKPKTPAKSAKAVSKGKETTTPARSSTRRSGRGVKEQPIDLSSDSDLSSVPNENNSDDDSVVDITPTPQRRAPSKPFDQDLIVPHYWTEALSPVTNKYMPVDPITLKKIFPKDTDIDMFAPRGPKAKKSVMAYVVGYSPDGSAKDVTVRYLKNKTWPGVTKDYRLGPQKIAVYDYRGKRTHWEEYDFFKSFMSGYLRGGKSCPRTEIDDHEDSMELKPTKPKEREVKEGPETLSSLKKSKEFVLARDLKREEALLPSAKHVRMFTVKGKGDAPSTEEKVFLRKDIVLCKTVETWHKAGRAPKFGEEPRKHAPWRAATTNRRRELAEAAAAAGGVEPLQPLYSEDQTDWIIPDPIVDGVIPKNSFGNMDAYVPTMIPRGAVHIPYRGTKSVCKKLGIDFAEAVTGFEFGGRMAVPIITGVVVAEENEEMVFEQWRVDELERERKEDEKRTQAAIGNWRKLMKGLIIGERIREEYGELEGGEADIVNPWTNRKKSVTHHANAKAMQRNEEEMGGGFFPEGHNEEEAGGGFFSHAHEDDDHAGGGFFLTHDDHDHDDEHMVVDDGDNTKSTTAYPTPISMESKTRGRTSPVQSDDDEDDDVPPPRPSASKSRAKATPKATPKRKAAVKKTVIDDSEEEEDDDEEDLPPKSAKGKKVARAAPRRKSTKRKADDESAEEEPPKKISAPTRATPRRSAATAVKSPYFEGVDDDDDE